ncbi:type II toxin-antitoxin system VapC family toxin [Methanobrevibacter sp.]|uniref:type II toxin-antitoxin system VapC family toxin n=1 Tax=Methanobrevibacter sp. TaxID=66852 RepID=UPI0038686B97
MIFLDTSYLKGLIYGKDSFHSQALGLKEQINKYNEVTVINTTVLVETLNWSVKTNKLANRIFNEINSKNMIINLDGDDYLKALEINCWFGNSINYGDCTIIKTMRDMSINKIATFDHDFDNIGGFEVISS